MSSVPAVPSYPTHHPHAVRPIADDLPDDLPAGLVAPQPRPPASPHITPADDAMGRANYEAIFAGAAVVPWRELRDFRKWPFIRGARAARASQP